MKTLLSALVLTTTLTSAALAGPVVLTEAQLDAVTAGGGGVGVDPSVYGSGAGVDPSVTGTKGTAGQGGDTNIVFPTND